MVTLSGNVCDELASLLYGSNNKQLTIMVSAPCLFLLQFDYLFAIVFIAFA